MGFVSEQGRHHQEHCSPPGLLWLPPLQQCSSGGKWAPFCASCAGSWKQKGFQSYFKGWLGRRSSSLPAGPVQSRKSDTSSFHENCRRRKVRRGAGKWEAGNCGSCWWWVGGRRWQRRRYPRPAHPSQCTAGATCFISQLGRQRMGRRQQSSEGVTCWLCASACGGLLRGPAGNGGLFGAKLLLPFPCRSCFVSHVLPQPSAFRQADQRRLWLPVIWDRCLQVEGPTQSLASSAPC